MISISRKQPIAADISISADAVTNAPSIDSESFAAASRISRRRWLVRAMVANVLLWIAIIVIVRLSIF